MKVAVFHGSPRKGNTFHATRIFMDELSACGDVYFTEFFLPKDLPEFCIGCQLCLSGAFDKCPNAQYVVPILDAISAADALLFATPHYGACSMTGAIKNLFDHIDFLILPVSPRAEMFDKKAFVITTGTGSAAALRPITKVLKHWGINRVYSLGIRMYTTKWDKMKQAKREKYEKALRQSAHRFYSAKKKPVYLSTVFFFHASKFVLKRYVGEGNHPYEKWKEKGYFKKRPF